jgi:urease accessory protein
MQTITTDSPCSPAEAELLQLMWLASPALPVGGFSYSEGLEAAVDKGCATTETQVQRWLLDQLQLCLARSDLAAVAQGMHAWRAQDAARLRALDNWVMCTRESSELRAQTLQMGRSLLLWLRQHTTASARDLGLLAQLAPSYPIAFALAVSATGASPKYGLLSYAFGWAENMVQAAIKAVPLGQSAGQRILSALTAHIPAAVQHALDLPEQDRQAFAPMLAILSAQHETQYSRLFRS